VEPLGEHALVVKFEGWLVVANFGVEELVGEVFSQTFKLPPLGVAVQRAR
jgi:hypothetical protein